MSARPNQPIEVGTVTWQRELSDALVASSESGKPVFALFQEVPGCAGCKQFGADVLSDPLVVEAIEHEFVPLLIHNNTGGRDAEVLAAYDEPAWNYQVVRFLDDAGDDLIPRRDRVWTTGPLLTRMVSALEAAGRAVSPSLRLLEQQHAERLEEAFLVQACFWTGEAQIGRIDGVVTTEAGFMHGHEVTRVEFDPEVTTLAAVVDEAARHRVADAVFVDDPDQTALRTPVRAAGRYRVAPEGDQKRQLGGRVAPGLTPSQLTKLNAHAHHGPHATDDYLFPSQRR